MTRQKCDGLWHLNLSTLNQPSAANFVTTTSTNNQGLSKPTLALQRLFSPRPCQCLYNSEDEFLGIS